MKFLLPIRQITIKSNLGPNDVIKRLKEKIQYLPGDGFLPPSQYEKKWSSYSTRKVINDQFTIEYTNSNGKRGMTNISGTILHSENGSTISMRTRLTPSFVFFLTVLWAFPVWHFIKDFGRVLISAEYTFSQEAHPWLFVPMLIPVLIMHSILMILFSIECNRGKKFMLAAIEGWEERS